MIVRLIGYVAAFFAGATASSIGPLLSLLFPRNLFSWWFASLIGAITGSLVAYVISDLFHLTVAFAVSLLFVAAVVNDASRIKRREGLLKSKAIAEMMGDVTGYVFALCYLVWRGFL